MGGKEREGDGGRAGGREIRREGDTEGEGGREKEGGRETVIGPS